MVLWEELPRPLQVVCRRALLHLHHLVCDHEALDALFDELNASLEGRELSPAEPYRNHVAQVLADSKTEETEAYFRAQLDDVEEPTAPFGCTEVHRAADRRVAERPIDATVAERVRGAARRLGVGPAALFHAAWAMVTARCSRREDVVFGTMLLGRLRDSAAGQGALGMFMFMNTLPLRVRLDGVTARELVYHTQRALGELLEHEQGSLAVAQRCCSVPSPAPLFTSLLNYRHSRPAGDRASPSALHREWLENHGRYWAERLEGGGRVQFPRDVEAPGESGWGMVPIRIDRDLKERLQAWCRAQRTTLVMTLLAAYVAAVMRWCRTSDVILQYAIDGRVDAKAERAIGFFASLLYLRIRGRTDDFGELLRTVTQEYCQAFEHADSYYLATQVPRPEFTRTAMFNFVPLRGDSGGSRLDALESGLTCEPIPCSQLMLKSLELDYEPMMVLFEAPDGIVGGVHFARQRFSRQAMEEFGQLFLWIISKHV